MAGKVGLWKVDLRQGLHGFLPVNERAKMTGVFSRQQFRYGHDLHCRISHISIAFLVGQTCCFDFKVQPVHGQRVCAGHPEFGKDIEYDQCGEALAVGRTLQDLIPLIMRGYGIDIFAPGLFEILQPMQAAKAFQVGHQVFGHLSFVKTIATLFGYPAQGLGKQRLGMHVAGIRNVSLG